MASVVTTIGISSTQRGWRRRRMITPPTTASARTAVSARRPRREAHTGRPSCEAISFVWLTFTTPHARPTRASATTGRRERWARM